MADVTRDGRVPEVKCCLVVRHAYLARSCEAYISPARARSSSSGLEQAEMASKLIPFTRGCAYLPVKECPHFIDIAQCLQMQTRRLVT